MKNKVTALLLATSMSISLVACGSRASSSTSTETTIYTSTASSEVVSTTAKKTEYPLTIDVYNINGELVPQTYTQAPTRVIPYTSSAVFTMLELGLGDKIVGIMAPDNDPPDNLLAEYEKLNVIGDKMSVSKESLIALEPDLMFGRVMSLSDDSYGTVESYNDMGINVYTQKASSFAIDQSLDNIFEDVLNIGKIFDVQEKAEEYVASLKERLATVKAEVNVDKTAEPLKAMLIVRYDNGTFSAFGSNSTLQNTALGEINIENVVSGTAGQMTDENIVALNPDVIIYVTADRNAEFDANAKENILNNASLADVPAVANNKFVEIPYETLMDYGPSIIDGIEIVYEGVYAQ